MIRLRIVISHRKFSGKQTHERFGEMELRSGAYSRYGFNGPSTGMRVEAPETGPSRASPQSPKRRRETRVKTPQTPTHAADTHGVEMKAMSADDAADDVVTKMGALAVTTPKQFDARDNCDSPISIIAAAEAPADVCLLDLSDDDVFSIFRELHRLTSYHEFKSTPLMITLTCTRFRELLNERSIKIKTSLYDVTSSLPLLRWAIDNGCPYPLSLSTDLLVQTGRSRRIPKRARSSASDSD